MKHDPYATAFKDNKFTNYKHEANVLRSNGWSAKTIREKTGVNYIDMQHTGVSPFDPTFMPIADKEYLADQQDMADQRAGVIR